MSPAVPAALLELTGSVQDHTGAWLDAPELRNRVRRLARDLTQQDARVVGIDLPNGADWIVADLACALAGVTCVPLPPFFTRSQRQHLLETTGMDHEIGASGIRPLLDLPKRRPKPHGPGKITFTSGTTGTPRGIRLSLARQLQVANSLATVTRDLQLKRHLCLLPLAVLLENVAGVYAAMLSGADLILPPPTRTGLLGSSGFDASVLVDTLLQERPHSMILLPEMLKLLVASLESTATRLESLRFAAVGGARTAPELLLRARALGIPVFEGYGLSECASVVSVNCPGADRPGSVGRPLPHAPVRISANGEIEVGMEDPASGNSTWLATGDLGHQDDDGFVYVNGRARQVLITAYGRNVSPEWVESELLSEPPIVQAMVLGDDQPGLGALLVTMPGVSRHALLEALDRVNERLPDYARICGFRQVDPFTAAGGQVTANGRLRRPTILADHAGTIESLFDNLTVYHGEHHHHELLPDTA